MADFEPEVVAPVAPVAPATPAPDSPPVEQASETPPGEKPPEQPEKTYSQKEYEEAIQKRLAKESRRIERIAVEKARREHAERELERLRAERSQPPEVANEPQGEPKPEQFKDYESYVRALTRWEIQQSLKGAETREQTERQKREAFEKSRAMREKIVAPGSVKYEDFEEVALAEDVPISSTMAEAIMETEIPSEVAYFLGSHRDEAERISKLSAVNQIREIDKIVAKLTKEPEPTKAPPPIEPNKGKGSVQKDPSDMSYDEFVAFRRRQVAARS